LTYDTYMENTTTTLRPLPNVAPQERLAYAWAVAQAAAWRAPSVNERLLDKCRKAAWQLSTSDAWMLLAEVPSLAIG
jgi:hypothetical protein